MRSIGKSAPLLALGVFALAGIAAIQWKSSSDRQAAVERYRQASHHEALLAAQGVGDAIEQIYQNMRTISLLASVRRIDRHGDSLSLDGRQAVQQLYNSLAGNIDVSEVYIVPADLNPDIVDLLTKQNEAPILMFDKVRLGLDPNADPDDPPDPSLPAQEEIYEYHALQKEMDHFHETAESIDASSANNIAFDSSPQVITCDNDVYNKTRVDEDRTGVMFSVPFYSESNHFRGTITAIILNSAVAKLLPAKNFALIDTRHGGRFLSAASGQQQLSAPSVKAGEPDASLIYSETLPVSSHAAENFMKVWSGRPDSDFYDSAEYRQLGMLALVGYVTIGLIVLFGVVLWRLVVVSFERSRRAEAEMQTRLSERTDELKAAMAHAERERVEAEGRRRGAQEVAIREERALVVDTIGKGLARLAEQDLRYRIDAQLPNAYEGLRKNFDVALHKLEHAVAGVAGGVDTLRGAAVGIRSDADLLSRHADEQTASLERAVRAQQAIGDSVKRSLTSAAEAQKVVEVARHDAATSEAAVHRSIEAMKEIEASSRQISQIIVVIDEIAFQTNLLALNAGVEAARAGDAGRGFAVVAQEVRGLAQKSAEAAKQIKALIAQSSAQVVEGAELVAENGASLRRMVERVLEINGVMAGVSEGAKASATSLVEIAEVFEQMNDLAESNAKVAERSASAARDLTERTDELADHIERFAFADPGPGKARALAA